ncbi:MAG: prenyltransferase [Bacteroidaceae bacterium]|nr:prenyltransferase [Bacteroidaceae bacterium]
MERTVKDWIVATRPWSFPASTMPVVVTTCMMYYLHDNIDLKQLIPCALTLVMMCLLQASGNLISDYADHVKGVDQKGSLNGVRHIQSGLFQPIEILTIGWCILCFCALLGSALIIWWDLSLFPLGFSGLLLTVFYPFLKYHALGDLDILLCYALLPSVGTAHLIVGRWEWSALLLSLTYGLMTVAILHANNTRDSKSDARVGAVSLAALIGPKTSAFLYTLEVLLPYIILGYAIYAGFAPYFSLLAFVVLPLSVKHARRILKAEPYDALAIADLDQKTAQMQLLFSLLLSLGYLIGIVVG